MDTELDMDTYFSCNQSNRISNGMKDFFGEYKWSLH